MKRGIVGVYHHVSVAHLNRYCAELHFCYNTREDTHFERSMQALRGICDKRLTCRWPDASLPDIKREQRLLGRLRQRF